MGGAGEAERIREGQVQRQACLCLQIQTVILNIGRMISITLHQHSRVTKHNIFTKFLALKKKKKD